MMFVTAAHAQPAPTAETHSETGAAHGGGEAHFPPFNPDFFASQILWLAITFALFYLFMQKAVVPRIGGILENRRDRIAQDLDEAGRLKEQSDAAIAAYEQELAEARSKASAIAQQAHDKAKAEAEAERAEVEAGLAKKTDEAEKNIAGIKARALGEIGTIAEDTTAAIVERLIGTTVSKTEAASAVAAAGGK
jgi:F-type H+-transporting ATPase subunit b